MSYKVDKATGGPYAHEIDAIRDERHRAGVMNVEPDWDNVFKDAVVSTGANAVIQDIGKPVEVPQGDFVENVVFHAEEETAPEDRAEETAEEADNAGTPTDTSEVPVPKPRHAVEEVKELDDMFAGVQ